MQTTDTEAEAPIAEQQEWKTGTGEVTAEMPEARKDEYSQGEIKVKQYSSLGQSRGDGKELYNHTCRTSAENRATQFGSSP